LRKFRTAQGGNVLITFALSLVPIIGLVGAAVDYSRANSAKAALQSAIDATALMLSKNIAKLTTDQITQETTDYFYALFNRPEVTGITITPTYTTVGGQQVVISARGTVDTTFMRILGENTVGISASSTVRWGQSRLRVSLVLDNTGSMADDGKMDALKTATKNLLTQLQGAATQADDVYVSIIPFSKDVAVDPATNYTQSWIDWTDWDNVNGSCSRGSSFNNKSDCTAQPVCSKSQFTSQSRCEDRNGTWYTTAGTWTVKNHNTWNGCFTDRGDSSAPNTGNYDTNVDPPITGNRPTLYPAEQFSSCTKPVMALNTDWSAMGTLIDSMTPNGNTNQAIGLVWGWLSLVGGGPFSTPPAMDPDYDYQQIIILLTDGLNTQDRWYNNASSIDDREKLTCANVKAAGFTIYAIQVNTGGDPTSTLLQNCASNATGTTDHFFLLTSADQIVTTFQQIGTALSNLRVAK
jgi:Flp pilus assembly protein TadG